MWMLKLRRKLIVGHWIFGGILSLESENVFLALASIMTHAHVKVLFASKLGPLRI